MMVRIDIGRVVAQFLAVNDYPDDPSLENFDAALMDAIDEIHGIRSLVIGRLAQFRDIYKATKEE